MGLAAACGLLVVLCVGLLAVPFDLRFQVRRDEVLSTRVRVAWLFGWIAHTFERKSAAPAPPTQTSGSPLGLLRDTEFVRALLEVARRLFAALELRELALYARFGLADPAETGMVLGLVSPFAAAARSHPGVRIELDPDFTAEILVGDLHGDVRVVPLTLLPPLVRFSLHRATLRAVRSALRRRLQRRRAAGATRHSLAR